MFCVLKNSASLHFYYDHVGGDSGPLLHTAWGPFYDLGLVVLYLYVCSCLCAGHYISDVLCAKEGTWKSYNDSVVTEIREEDVRQRRQRTGYIFFYMHKLADHGRI